MATSSALSWCYLLYLSNTSFFEIFIHTFIYCILIISATTSFQLPLVIPTLSSPQIHVFFFIVINYPKSS